MKRDILSVMDMKDDLEDIILLSIKLKRDRSIKFSEKKILGMIFEKPSTRTRISLESAMVQLNGTAIYLSPKEMHLGDGETIEDTARVMSRFLDIISYRAYSHDMVVELARYSRVPVLNALDNLEHPMQIVADFMTVYEKKSKLSGLKLAYIGDGNNMANSLLLGASILGMDISIACPENHEPDKEIIRSAREMALKTGSRIEIVREPRTAIDSADIVYTDVWVSMGEESERAEREKLFRPYQVNSELTDFADKNFIFMHCLPAHRGLEVTDDVIDGIHSVVFDEAENRLYSEKGIIYKVLS
ncbi:MULTISPECIES: ornithine carbamoyltransferase [Acidiplasma]|jgi:ornithine carbamoyltransferase|uniref:Ornithine carbamoyltransferase n=1 Tax=Acidiplasma cupricumulans TaxID=312540 RepID=A0A0Q0RST4_9ARCH|nr:MULTISPECIES: ornithine carbamoyltransferase [Acidiplasma]KJE49643.1 ornithine carbamoyltransferase [Acidiplasma sp. MBA-1]KQB35457.1 ornithine carbamoyltransferase [Acidiplasma cupricumulans]WMT55805.1 MAG: ornithine carbamoyltransferase [Acidiplasma sp.]